MKGYHDLTSTLSFHKPLGGTVVVRAYQGQEVHVVSVSRLVCIFALSLSCIPCPVLSICLTLIIIIIIIIIIIMMYIYYAFINVH